MAKRRRGGGRGAGRGTGRGNARGGGRGRGRGDLPKEEAAVLGMIRDLKSLRAECKYINDDFLLMYKIEELTEILDFYRILNMEERSRLKYLMADLVELAHDVSLETNSLSFGLGVEIQMTMSRIKNFVADEENIGDKEEEAEEEEVVVGLEESVKKLLDRVIFTNCKNLQILCIKGMIGIGKTTLARQLYKAGAGQFQRHAWVCISSGTTNKEILMKLVQQMVEGCERDPSLEEMDNQSLRRMLHQHLQGLSYFIVLDNMPKDRELWAILQSLPSQDFHQSRSTLLLTSRCEVKTEVDYTHEMKALDSDKSWRLFLKIVDKFTSDENKLTSELKMKGREMLKKCGGVPMAIIDVARQKAKQRLSGMAWEELFDSIDLSESLKLLEPMYHELDERVKKQFLYFSFFKENAIMRQEKLEQIWAINGLGSYHTHIFVHQSILEVEKQYSRYVKYRLNPLLHMISITKAEEKIGLEILRSNRNSRPSPSQNARHRVIHCGRDQFNHFTNEDSKQLISLIFHGGGGYVEGASSHYWESFESLKILDMEDFGVKTLSETIGALIELKYLGLRNNYIQEIPRSLGGLKKLKVLDIALNFMVEVPNTVGQIGNLSHLHMSNAIFRQPLKVDAMVLEHLETLKYISIYDWMYEGPSRMTMFAFKTLGIEEVDESSDVGTLFATLAEFLHVHVLFLRGFRYRSMPCLDGIGALSGVIQLKLDGRLSRLPSADNFPQRIIYITLVNTCLDEDPMPILEKLRRLSKLKLQNAYTGREMVIQKGELAVLCINELWNLRKIQVGEDAMRNLRELEINNCPHLETLPEQIRSMSKLQKFKMVTTKHIATKIRNSGLTSKIIEEDIYP